MKKLCTLILALCLALSCAAPAWAMEEELTDVTLAVKETLGLSDDYTSFNSSFYDWTPATWYLDWAKDGESLSVTAAPSGKIYNVYFWRETKGNDRFYGFDAAFPALSGEDARRVSEEWLSRLLGENETARIDDTQVSLSREGSRGVSGTVLINGLESPIGFSLQLKENGLYSFDRSDGYTAYVGDIPSPEAGFSEADAAALLREALGAELYYVSDGNGEARLRYVPLYADSVVDAASGAFIDARRSENGLYRTYAAEEAAMAADAASGLSAVEQLTVDAYKNVLYADALDETVRSLPSVGLEEFSLEECSYYMDEEGAISASLTYRAPMTEQNRFGFTLDSYYENGWDGMTVMKSVTVDAVTGELTELWTSYPLWGETETVFEAERLNESAEAFVAAAAPEQFAESARCELSAYSDGFTWAQTVNGYLFPENRLAVEMNTATGTVDSFHRFWETEAEFAPAEGIVDEKTALDAFADAAGLTLGYVAVPEGEDEYTSTYRLALGYYYGGSAPISGVDALTGEVLTEETGERKYSYDDIEGLSQKTAIERLAEAGIGFEGGSFLPKKTLTMKDAAALLLMANGSDVSAWDEDTIREQAIWLGFATDATWEPERELTRMEFIRMLLGASRYGDAAELTGIWDEAFSDVAAEDMGHAAIASALGMAGGDPLVPDVPCTRAAAAVALCRFMERYE